MVNSIHFWPTNRCSCESVEQMFLSKCRRFRDRKCLDLRGTRTPNLQIHANMEQNLYSVLSYLRYHLSQNIKCLPVFQVKDPNNSTVIRSPQMLSKNMLKLPSNLKYTHLSRQWNCSNYIFILHLTSGFNGLGTYNWKTRQETFNLGDLVHLILEVWQYV